MESISSITVTEARKRFSLPEEWQPSEKIIRDAVKSAASRADSWDADKEQAASSELNKAIRSIYLNVYREAGAAVPLAAAPDLEQA